MAKVNLSTLKNWFKTGLKPTQEQFFSAWDSFWHKDDTIPASNIEDFDIYLSEKADKEALENHINYNDAHLSYDEKNNLSKAFKNVVLNQLHNIDFTKVDGNIVRLDLDEWFQNKQNTEAGKGLSANDFTNTLKQKLEELRQIWEDTPNGYVRTKNSSRVAINKDDADFALDVGPKTIKTPLTGTASFDGFQLIGTGTSFLTELPVGSDVELSDGQIITVEDVLNNTTAYVFSGGNPSVDGEVSAIVKENKITNFGDLLKVFLSGKVQVEKEIEHNNAISKIITQDINGNTYREFLKATQPWGQFQKSYWDYQGNIKFIVRFGTNSGVRYLKLDAASNVTVVTIWEDGSIELPNLPTSPNGTNKLYKDSNGFLKIG